MPSRASSPLSVLTINLGVYSPNEYVINARPVGIFFAVLYLLCCGPDTHDACRVDPLCKLLTIILLVVKKYKYSVLLRLLQTNTCLSISRKIAALRPRERNRCTYIVLLCNYMYGVLRTE